MLNYIIAYDNQNHSTKKKKKQLLKMVNYPSSEKRKIIKLRFILIYFIITLFINL